MIMTLKQEATAAGMASLAARLKGKETQVTEACLAAPQEQWWLW